MAALLAALLLPGPARAALVTMHAVLTGAQEFPPAETVGNGVADIVVDTGANTLSYDIRYGGLTSPEIGAHIHGPAARGEVSFDLKHTLPTTDPKVGVWNYALSDEADILAGRMYINIHSQLYNTGELRGQIERPLPGHSSGGMVALALALFGASAVTLRRSRRRA